MCFKMRQYWGLVLGIQVGATISYLIITFVIAWFIKSPNTFAIILLCMNLAGWIIGGIWGHKNGAQKLCECTSIIGARMISDGCLEYMVLVFGLNGYISIVIAGVVFVLLSVIGVKHQKAQGFDTLHTADIAQPLYHGV